MDCAKCPLNEECTLSKELWGRFLSKSVREMYFDGICPLESVLNEGIKELYDEAKEEQERRSRAARKGWETRRLKGLEDSKREY